MCLIPTRHTFSLDALELLNWIAMVETGPLFFQIAYLGKEGRLYVGQSGQIDPSEIYVLGSIPIMTRRSSSAR